MTAKEYKKNWDNQYIPKDVAEVQEKIMIEAEKKGYTIPKAETLRILVKSYKQK